jgi:ankyrin repeat protein
VRGAGFRAGGLVASSYRPAKAAVLSRAGFRPYTQQLAQARQSTKKHTGFNMQIACCQLIAASVEGDAAKVERLISDSASNLDINVTAELGLTALHCASRAGHASVVSLLLKDKRIVTSLENSNGQTALQLAQADGHAEVIDLFLEADGCAYAGTHFLSLFSRSDISSCFLTNTFQTRGWKLRKSVRKVCSTAMERRL